MLAWWAGPAHSAQPTSHCFRYADNTTRRTLDGRRMCVSATACWERAMCHSAVPHGHHPRAFKRHALAYLRQPGDLRAHRHAHNHGAHTNSRPRDVADMNLAFPYRFDTRHRTAQSSDADHVRELIEQVLFTAPGERVNRPDFGCGLPQAVFGPNSPEVATAAQFLVQGALQQNLGDIINLVAVEITSQDSTLTVLVRYILRTTQEEVVAQFSRGGPGL